MNYKASRQKKIFECVNPKFVDETLANYFGDKNFVNLLQSEKDASLFRNYVDSMGKSNRETNTLMEKLYDNRILLKKIYLVLVTRQHNGSKPEFQTSYHAMVVIETYNKIDKYLSISHQNKGRHIILSNKDFPFELDDDLWEGNAFTYNEDPSVGGIFFTSDIKKGATGKDLVISILRWWHINDLMTKGGASSFPSNCYGLAESMLYLFSKDRKYPVITGSEYKKPLNPFNFSSSRSKQKNKLKCPYGVKKSGECKKKPGPKSRRRSRRSSRRRSRRRSRKVSRRRSSRRRSSRRRSRRRLSRRRSRKVSRRRLSRRRSRKVSRRRSSRPRSRKSKYMTVSRCKDELKDKIRVNIGEYNDGKYVSRSQAIAVAYAQIKKKYPQCKNKI